MISTKSHWENIYATKQPDEVSWTQDIPEISLEFFGSANLDKSASIIDVGGGDSKLVDYLLKEGYKNITVLDISENAINRAKKRLGDNSQRIEWIITDITKFTPKVKYNFWHDRAVFHFLTQKYQVDKYISIAESAIVSNGYLTIGTFSKDGPKKCSGLNILQYDERSLANLFAKGFQKISCITEDHITPFNTKQNFIYGFFRKINE